MPTESHKDMAISFLKSASSGQVKQAYQDFVHDDFTHHNPYFQGDRQSLLDGMKKNAENFPNKKFEIKLALEEGDMVVIHGRVQIQENSPWIALVHIFRFLDHKIIEEWEVSQEVPVEMINKHGMF